MQRNVGTGDFQKGEYGNFKSYNILGITDGISSPFQISHEHFNRLGQPEIDEIVCLQGDEVKTLVKCLLGGISDKIVNDINKF